MVTSRRLRTLSAFDRSARTWRPIPSRTAQSQVAQRLSPTSRNIDTSRTQRLSLLPWNIDAFSSRPVSRANLILSHLLDGPKSPDIIFLQEVTPDVRASLLDNPRVRAALLVTDTGDQTSVEGVPFATMTLLSSARFASDLDSQEEGGSIKGGGKFMLGCVSRGWADVGIIPPTAPGTVFRLVNVHLDSLRDTLPYRAQQIKLLADVVREPGCGGGGIIAGDFNAISPKDEGLVDENDLVDAWVALHERAGPGGATWGVGESVEIPWSDHYGLRCTFTI
ncbi:Endonuclease/exonuclease/phosphatase [Lactifluus subvellereus]|nr:Endonuclease/exonuclease/phosphatase [Lactifluus subvellereus]